MPHCSISIFYDTVSLPIICVTPKTPTPPSPACWRFLLEEPPLNFEIAGAQITLTSGPFVFGETLGKHFTANFVIKEVGINPFPKVRREAFHLLSASHYSWGSTIFYYLQKRSSQVLLCPFDQRCLHV